MPTDQQFLSTIVQIVERGRNSNSYKFALLRALAERGSSAQGVTVPHRWIAERFLHFYWPLTVRFKVRQASDTNRDPVIVRLVRGAVTKYQVSSDASLEEFRAEQPTACEQLIDQAWRRGGCLDEVLPRFHNVDGLEVSPKLFERHDTSIELSPDSVLFLGSNHRVLRLLAVGAWVRFTEQFTNAPRLYEKIWGVRPSRRSLLTYLETLVTLQGGRCFYCASSLATSAAVDHVIPWTYILEDRAWNLVAACISCNSQKRDQLPPARSVEALLSRNSDLLTQTHLSQPSRMARDLAELRGRNLREHFVSLVNGARQDGFHEWTGGPRS